MFREILRTQAKWSVIGVVVGAVIAFALPLLTVNGMGSVEATWLDTRQLLGEQRSWSKWYPLLALMVGLVIGTAAWTHDHRSRHLYALTLPLPRWQLVLLRYGAGLVLLGAPILALAVGASVAAATAAVPVGLHTYPLALALRFAVATALAYSIFFAISSGTTKTAGYVLSAIGAVVVLQLLFGLFRSDANLLTAIFDRMVTWPGPFEIFSGRWMLIDV